MNIHLVISLASAGISAGVVAYALVRSLSALRTRADSNRASAGAMTLRQLIAPVGAFVQRRRGSDVELERKLTSYEKLIDQAGGRFAPSG